MTQYETKDARVFNFDNLLIFLIIKMKHSLLEIMWIDHRANHPFSGGTTIVGTKWPSDFG
jgi:hypothetical protein